MLTDTAARKAKRREKTYRVADHGGLALEVRPSGAKVWRYRYRLHGKAGMFTVGDYPTVTLAEARQIRDWAKRQVAAGISPREAQRAEQEEQQAERENSLKAIGEEWLAETSHTRNTTYQEQAQRILRRDVWPTIGRKPIKEVTSADVLKIMKEVDRRGAPSVARLIRLWLSQIYRYAITTLRADSSPTEAVRGAVARPQTKHKAALGLQELAELVKTLWGKPGTLGKRRTEIATCMLALTFVRTGELRMAAWRQFDLDGDSPTWVIPAENMKRRAPHVVPLSRQAVALMKELQTITGHRELCFPNQRQAWRPMNAVSINLLLARAGYQGRFTGHAFRTTASTLLNSYGWDADWIERQLAHAPGDKIRASYNHAQYLPQRRAMLQWWADLIDALRRNDPVPALPAIADPASYRGLQGATAYPTASPDPEETGPAG